MLATNTVYTIHCPETNHVRYVGITRQFVKRKQLHLLPTGKSTPIKEWIRSLGTKPSFQIACEITSDRHINTGFSSAVVFDSRSLVQTVEKSLIRRIRGLGFPLLNVEFNDMTSEEIFELARTNFKDFQMPARSPIVAEIGSVSQ